ncbi:MAG TPA: DUF4157 domain-containing protein [Thermoanaerobaculia bacterium]
MSSGSKALATQAKSSAAPVSGLSLSPIRPMIQRKCECDNKPGTKCSCPEEEKGPLQREATGPAPSAVPSVVHDVLRSPGKPLDASTNSFMSSRFGHAFDDVRIHDDSQAAESARAVDARAYTVGRNIVFAANQYQPSSPDGSALIAHELAHTIQQGGLQASAVDTMPTEISSHGDASERQAAAAATAIMHGQRPHLGFRSHRGVIHRADWGPCEAGGAITPLEKAVPQEKGKPQEFPAETIAKKAEEQFVEYYASKNKSHLIVTASGVGGTITIDNTNPKGTRDERAMFALMETSFHSGRGRFGRTQQEGEPVVPVAPAESGEELEGAETPFEQVRGARAAIAPGALQYSRPDIADLTTSRIFDVTTEGQASGHKNYIAGLAKHLQTIVEGHQIGTPVWDAGGVPELGPQAPPELLNISYGQADRVICFGPTDFAKWPGVLVYKVIDKARKEGQPANTEPFDLIWGTAKVTVDAGPLATDLTGTPASTLISGALLTRLQRGTKGGDTVHGQIETKGLKNARPDKAIPIEVSEEDPVKFLVDPKTHELKPRSKKAKIAFNFKPLSLGTITELEYSPDGGLSGKGNLTPSIPLLSKINLGVAFAPGKLDVISEIPKEKLKALPGFRVKSAALKLQLAPEFKPSGELEFDVGPAKKPVADGKIEVTAEAGEFVAKADINVKIPGTDEAKGYAEYRPSTGWKGEAHVTSSKIPRVKRAAVDVLFNNEGMQLHGGLAVDLPGAGNELKLDVYKKGETYLFTGNAQIKVPIPNVEPLDLSFEYDTEKDKLKGKGATGVTVRGLQGHITVYYDDGKITGKGTLAVEKGRAKGKISVEMDEEARFFGEGEITYRVTENLITTVGIILRKDQSVTLKGAIEFPKPIQLFKPITGDFKIFEVGINIPIPGASLGPNVGVQARIEGELSAGYAIGPGELRNVKIEAAFNPLDEKPDLDLRMGAQLYIGASAHVTGKVRGGIALEIAIASVAGGLEVSATATLAGEVLASVSIHYQKSRFELEADFSVLLALILTLALNAWVRAQAGFGPFKVETGKTWELASYRYDPGLQLGMKLKKKLRYASDEPFQPPSLSDIEWITPKIDPKAMIEKIFSGSKQEEKTKE